MPAADCAYYLQYRQSQSVGAKDNAPRKVKVKVNVFSKDLTTVSRQLSSSITLAPNIITSTIYSPRRKEEEGRRVEKHFRSVFPTLDLVMFGGRQAGRHKAKETGDRIDHQVIEAAC